MVFAGSHVIVVKTLSKRQHAHFACMCSYITTSIFSVIYMYSRANARRKNRLQSWFTKSYTMIDYKRYIKPNDPQLSSKQLIFLIKSTEISDTVDSDTCSLLLYDTCMIDEMVNHCTGSIIQDTRKSRGQNVSNFTAR